MGIESPEGLDRKLTLNYYSRMRFASNLLPLLRPTASTTTPQFSRVLSILGAGFEGSINLLDLPLKKSFSASKCADHSTTMNSLMVSEFASREPGISFTHSSPGIVLTPIGRELPIWARGALKVLTPLLKISGATVSVEETGERQLFIATSGLFAPREGVKGVDAKELGVAKGADGKEGSGGYLVGWNGEITGKPVVKKYQEEGLGKTIWDHTVGVFGDVEKINEERK